MTVFFHTLGCKVNQYESEEMLEKLCDNGFIICENAENADVIVINSCTVTAESDRKSRQTVRKYKKANQNAIVVLTGCMPQAYIEQAKALIEADIVLGNKNNDRLLESIKMFQDTGERVFCVSEHKEKEPLKSSGISKFDERTRAFLKIEDGCDRFCSYCAIPYARGRVRSKPIDSIRKEAQALSDNGFSEIVLVGINLSAYGKDLDTTTFPDAVKCVADIDGIDRVRLGSLEPDHITDEVIEKLSSIKKLCPQFHISLQSGSNNTLKRMNRHYSAEEYLSLCKKLRDCFSDCTLTTDIMVGFSGETESDFNETLEFVKLVGFEKVHIFPYSVREGTKAAAFPDKVSNSEKARRAALLQNECEKIRNAFLSAQKNKKVNVLIEHKEKDGCLFGYTENYTPVKVFYTGKAIEKYFCGTVSYNDGEFCYIK